MGFSSIAAYVKPSSRLRDLVGPSEDRPDTFLLSEFAEKSDAREPRDQEAGGPGTHPRKPSSYGLSRTGADGGQSPLSHAERKLLWKLDRVIVPLTALLYLSAYMDRGNLGNARLQGLQAGPLGGSDTNYSIALVSFYITYIIFSIPGTLLAKQILPSTAIGVGALIWSIAASCMAGADSLGDVVASRLCIGIGEALFGQSVALLYSLWYKKDEIAKRLAIFIGAGALSGAFSGLIAFGVSKIDRPAIAPWRILFLIEGLPSIVLAVVVLRYLPSRPSHSSYITEDERALISARMNADSLGEGHTGIDWSGVKRALTNWNAYVISVIYSAMNLGLGSVSGYLPTLLKSLGYTSSDAQFYTVPLYAVALVFMVSLSMTSDRLKLRGSFAALVFAVSFVGWMILLLDENSVRIRYFGCFCIVSGGYGAIPILISWTANNAGSQTQRAVQLGMLNSIGQCLAVLAGFIFPSSEGPRYTRGCSINVAFAVLAFCLSIFMSVYYRMENLRRDRIEGGPPPRGKVLNVVEDHDLAVGFRYTP